MLTKEQIAQAEAQAAENSARNWKFKAHYGMIENLRAWHFGIPPRDATVSDFERRQLAEAEQIEQARAEGRY